MTDSEESPDFIDFNHDFEFEHDDIEYERNVTEGIEIGMDSREDKFQDERKEDTDNEFDELKLPSTKELLSQCLFDKDGKYHVREFSFDLDIKILNLR